MNALRRRSPAVAAFADPRADPIRTWRRRAPMGGAGTLPRVAEGEVRESLPDDRGIVQRGDQA